MHAVEGTQTKPEPSIRGFWKIDGLPRYEFNDFEIAGQVSKLVMAGATQVVINKVVIDENENIEPVSQTPQEVLVRGVVVNDATES